jgi:hypothetical protein
MSTNYSVKTNFDGDSYTILSYTSPQSLVDNIFKLASEEFEFKILFEIWIENDNFHITCKTESNNIFASSNELLESLKLHVLQVLIDFDYVPIMDKMKQSLICDCQIYFRGRLFADDNPDFHKDRTSLLSIAYHSNIISEITGPEIIFNIDPHYVLNSPISLYPNEPYKHSRNTQQYEKLHQQLLSQSVDGPISQHHIFRPKMENNSTITFIDSFFLHSSPFDATQSNFSSHGLQLLVNLKDRKPIASIDRKLLRCQYHFSDTIHFSENLSIIPISSFISNHTKAILCKPTEICNIPMQLCTDKDIPKMGGKRHKRKQKTRRAVYNNKRKTKCKRKKQNNKHMF